MKNLARYISVALVIISFLFQTTPIFADAHTWNRVDSLPAIVGDAPKMDADADGSNLIYSERNGRLYTSNNSGLTWTERQPAGDTNKTWASVASDADGSNLFVAVNNGRLYTSSNSGVDWTERQPAGNTSIGWSDVASDADGSNLIAVSNGRIYTSADSGGIWTERQPMGDTNQQWFSVASDSDGSNLIVSVYGGRLFTSDDSGVTWDERQPAGDVDYNWGEVASDADGSNLIVGSNQNTGSVYISDDAGETWEEQEIDGHTTTHWSTVSSDADGSNLLAGIYGNSLYSSDDAGVTWFLEDPTGVSYGYGTGSTIIDTGDFFVASESQGLFSTLEDTIPPYISELSPVDEGTEIDVDQNLGVAFYSSIATSTGNITIYKASDDSVVEAIDIAGAQVAFLDPNELTIDPTTSLAYETEYYVFIDAGAIEDENGNAFPGIADETTWNFTTEVAPIPQVFDFERVSVDGAGVEGDATSQTPSLSSDGRYVAFESSATNLVPDDINAVMDIFVFDRELDTIERVSVDGDGIEGDDESTDAYISSDGRYVVFESAATNLTGVVPTSPINIFLYDRELDTIEQINEDGAGNQSFGNPSISDDGNYIAFYKATNAFFSRTEIVVYDRTHEASSDVTSPGPSEHSTNPTVSRDGTFVVFDSTIDDLIVDDGNGAQDVFVYDVITTEIERVSVNDEGVEGDSDSSAQSISSDGRYVAFISNATNLTDDVVSGDGAVFVHDRNSGTTELIGISYIEVDQVPEAPVTLSADGRYVVYSAYAEGGSDKHVYRYDRDEDVELLVTEGVGEADGYAYAINPTISGEGTTIAFDSENTDLVASDTNGAQDVFVVELPEDEEEPEEEEEENDGGGRNGSSGGHRSSGSPALVGGTSNNDLLTLLRTLITQFIAQGGTPTPAMLAFLGMSTSAGGYTRDLDIGSQGSDVLALQNFLIAQNKGIAAQTLAANGATGYFGPLTQAALAEFQASVGISPAVGYFGPITRAYINGL